MQWLHYFIFIITDPSKPAAQESEGGEREREAEEGGERERGRGGGEREEAQGCWLVEREGR